MADRSNGQLMPSLYRLRRDNPKQCKAETIREARLGLLDGPDPAHLCAAARGEVLASTAEPNESFSAPPAVGAIPTIGRSSS